MSTNPLYNTNDSPNNQTQPTKAVNRQGVYVPHTHNTFDMSYFNFKTQKFGQYEPFFVMEGVAGDTIPFSNSHNVRALPMSSPFLSSLKLNKDYFLVPNQAIQPNTYEYIFRNPTQGDDVPDDAYNIFNLFLNEDFSFLQDLFEQFKSGNSSNKLYALLTLELFCSSGSLLYNLGYKLNPIIVYDGVQYSFDSFFDLVIDDLVAKFTITTDSGTFYFATEGAQYPEVEVDKYTAISLLRRYGSLVTNFSQLSFKTYEFTVRNLPQYNDKTAYINMDRLAAYQLSCYQYYVNPQVDFIYNAQLYRDNILSLYHVARGTDRIYTFQYNGLVIPYDYLSNIYYYEAITACSRLNQGSVNSLWYDYFSALFGLNESLRFGDYFTDSRTRPLAIGDDTVTVVNNGVSVIDMSKSIIYQRFRNAAIKLGNNFGDYLRGIFGTSPSPDYHIPKYIVHQEFDISGFEVSNTTAEQQGNIVTNLNSQDDRMAFEIQVDMPCVVIGISYFTLPRVYCQTKDRQFFHQNRFDFFNPMLQYIGDQAVFNDERTDSRPNDEVFGYQSRYNEYKQRYGVVSGGFVDILPAYTFVTDSIFDPVTDITVANTQSPDFIRSHDYEFNRFMSRIPGTSLGHGFHFIVVYNNKCVCSRPMEINPSTL